MKAVIIDDEPLAIMIVKEYLQTYPDIEIAQECNDGFEGVKAIMQHKPDLIFLDIQMPKINGFEMLELIEEPPAVIFTTAFDEYAIKAFESHAIDYLLKPYSKERFDKAVQKFLSANNNGAKKSSAANTQALLESAAESPSQNNRVVVKNSGKIKIIPVDTINYLEAADDYVKIVTKEGAFLKNKTMSFFEKTLNPQVFVRVHRSFIVNINEISKLDVYEKDSYIATLRDGSKVSVSKTGYPKLKSVLGL
ncbi:LytR/AlgR family response regulator transcription factor [Pinibacter aurantiacus]|uniref:LytTR family transcriptional regulator DNA-binding domain-containing protein n=1 Tax=Pinibacter aurantiacus TaxID=2851599 RepID=A0A9E2SAT2_9BACT|nr:LytTR family transcriptional regulator DNA-binding domain-containing protein [Pinibacter aurantiacus]MBV4358018.1 LytTR family transcriptional regulator DNA-binding domain-containing protein [Pinibacter aurantiacus]